MTALFRIAIFIAMATGTILASQPGQPLGPEDWVFNEPGMWAEIAFPPCVSTPIGWRNDCYLFQDSGERQDLGLSDYKIDVQGRLLQLGFIPEVEECGTTSVGEWRLAAISPTGIVTVLATLRERCSDPAAVPSQRDSFQSASPSGYDPNNGTILISGQRIDWGATSKYFDQRVLFRIHGLPNNFDILTTFTPDTSQLTWSSPFMPMGLPARAADSFDVFRGNPEDLRASGPAGFGAMESVECDVGAEDLPEVGKRYAVGLPVQESPVEYYLVAAKAGGEERYGRWQMENGGAAKGRSSVAMPPCQSPGP